MDNKQKALETLENRLHLMATIDDIFHQAINKENDEYVTQGLKYYLDKVMGEEKQLIKQIQRLNAQI